MCGHKLHHRTFEIVLARPSGYVIMQVRKGTCRSWARGETNEQLGEARMSQSKTAGNIALMAMGLVFLCMGGLLGGFGVLYLLAAHSADAADPGSRLTIGIGMLFPKISGARQTALSCPMFSLLI